VQPVLVSGGISCTSGMYEFGSLITTIAEMDNVERAFEDLRTKLNGMNIKHPEHSVFPQVFGLIETVVGPFISNKKIEDEFVESMRITMQSVIPNRGELL
jgi:hypothetical protein